MRIRALQRGNTETFAEIYREHKDAVYRYACALTGRSTEAEDLLQEAFLGLLRNVDRVSQREPLLPYLLRAVKHRHIDRLRSFSGRQRTLPEREPPDPRESLDEATSRNERIESVAAAIAELPEPQGEVVRLRTYAGLSYEDIAAMLSVPRDTVRSRYRAALERLRERLGRKVEDA